MASEETRLPSPTIPDFDQLQRITSGALRDCIRMHGPVTGETIGSASKRISAQLIGYLRELEELRNEQAFSSAKGRSTKGKR